MAGSEQSSVHDNEIWNPWAALALSLIFTPVFGAMLHGTDLRHIGDRDAAATAWCWERGSMWLLAIAAVLQPIAAHRAGWGLLLFVTDMVLLVAWAACCGVRHAMRISEAEKLSKRLVRVPFSRAISLGLLGVLAWFALFYTAKYIWMFSGIIPVE